MDEPVVPETDHHVGPPSHPGMYGVVSKEQAKC
jgi:hypothetical protein